jgi:hypothetical protein
MIDFASTVAADVLRRLRESTEYQANLAKAREERRALDAVGDRLWAKLKEHNASKRSKLDP